MRRASSRANKILTTCLFDDGVQTIAPLQQGVYGGAVLRGLWKIVLHERCPIQNDLFAGMSIRASKRSSEASPADGTGDDKAGGVEKSSDLSFLRNTFHEEEGFPEALSKLYRKKDKEDRAGREEKETDAAASKSF